MSHQPVRTMSQLSARIRDEADEVHRATEHASLIEEVIDTVGWLEAALVQLEPDALSELLPSLLRARVTHESKCTTRGLLPLRRTYAFFRGLEDAIVMIREAQSMESTHDHQGQADGAIGPPGHRLPGGQAPRPQVHRDPRRPVGDGGGGRGVGHPSSDANDGQADAGARQLDEPGRALAHLAERDPFACRTAATLALQLAGDAYFDRDALELGEILSCLIDAHIKALRL